MNMQRDSAGETSSVNVFAPFGGGQRRCPGYELARVGLSVFLHHMVTRFRYVILMDFAVCVCAYCIGYITQNSFVFVVNFLIKQLGAC